MHTEDEASKMICCSPDGVGDADREEQTCAASRCMGWRWVEVSRTAGDGYKTWKERDFSKTRGYCGRAGQP